MKREWKPGDVAAWDISGQSEVIFRCAPAPTYAEEIWQTADGGEGFPKPDQIRPLVVIDPEDREQVERLVAAIETTVGGKAGATAVRDMQAALREFANPTPPKPEEPTGLGAVVEDADGVQYVLVTGDDEFPWAKAPAGDWQIECLAWDEFTAVRILSEGVPA